MIGVDLTKECSMDVIAIGPSGEECGLKERRRGLYLYQGYSISRGEINE